MEQQPVQPPSPQPHNIADAGLIAGMMDFGFTRFITLGVIKVLYILGLVAVALAWLFGVGSGFANGGFTGGLAAIVMVTVGGAIYAIMLRVWLELIVVIFRIGENTSKMAEKPTA